MSNPSTAYSFAKELHDVFRGESDLMSGEERMHSGVVIGKGHMSDTEQVIAWDEQDGVRFSQTLSLGRNGLYYFSTVYGYPDGRYERKTISETSGEDTVELLAKSAFVKSFQKVIRDRRQ